jgi:hypothetical protein
MAQRRWRKGYKPHGYLNAIVFHGEDLQHLQAASYHTIKDSTAKKQKFYRFAEEKFPLVKYVNWYNCVTKQFTCRVYKNEFFT